MKPTLYWQQAPRSVVRDLLPKLTWQRLGEKSAARDTAALMLYVALLFVREEVLEDFDAFGVPGTLRTQVATATYDELAQATGLSRKLIREGLERLEELEVIKPRGSNQKRGYELTWSTDGWFKLPCRAIVRDGQIVPFTHFRLRSKHELNAMKLYLYLARVIGRGKTYAEASYEKIFEGIGVQERDIRRAISVLIASGLLRNVDRKDSGDETGWGPNMYYLAGHQDLFRNPARRAAEEAAGETTAA